MSQDLQVEPLGSKVFPPCDCCGTATQRVWGGISADDEPVAMYLVEWTLGRVDAHGALFDIIVGAWGDEATAEQRAMVTLEYRVTPTGPAFMVVDRVDRPTDRSDVVERVLARAEVVGQPIAVQVFAVADAVLAQDGRVAELLEPAVRPAAKKRWWRFGRSSSAR